MLVLEGTKEHEFHLKQLSFESVTLLKTQHELWKHQMSQGLPLPEGSTTCSNPSKKYFLNYRYSINKPSGCVKGTRNQVEIPFTISPFIIAIVLALISVKKKRSWTKIRIFPEKWRTRLKKRISLQLRGWGINTSQSIVSTGKVPKYIHFTGNSNAWNS